jgi:hypothetical protein
LELAFLLREFGIDVISHGELINVIEDIDTGLSQHTGGHEGQTMNDLLSKSAANTLQGYKQKHNGDAGTFPALRQMVHDTVTAFEQPCGALEAKYD